MKNNSTENKYLTNEKSTVMENKYVEGDIVYAKIDPSLKLIIRRYVNNIYYCKIQEDPTRKELVYFERELMTTNDMKEDRR